MGDGGVMFYLYQGDTMGIETNEKHLIYRWGNLDCKILFSICRRGNSASCHFASDKRGLRLLKKACNEFVDFVLNKYRWCKNVVAVVNKKSVCRLVEKIDFELLGYANGSSVYMRVK